MAYGNIDKWKKKRMTESFQEQGLPILNFDDKSGTFSYYRVEDDKWRDFYVSKIEEKHNIKWEKDNYAYPQNQNYYTEPLRFQDAKTGNEYLYFYNTDWNYSDDKTDWKKNRVAPWNFGSSDYELVIDNSILVKKGKSFLVDETITIPKGESSEFSAFDNFDDIKAPDYSTIFATDPTISEEIPEVKLSEITKSQNDKAKELLEKSKKELADLKKADKEGRLETEMWTFEEIDALYNKGISTDAKRAFVIYLQNILQRKVKGGFDDHYGSSYPAEPETILELMKKGELFYDGSADKGKRLQPKVMWTSGNIFRKNNYLKNKPEEIIQRFGQELYDKHLKTLEEPFQELWDNRLRLGGKEKRMQLKMLPIGDMAKSIKITEIVNPHTRSEIEKNFRVYTRFKKVKGVVELQKDWLNELGGVADDNFINQKYISLQEGFLRWLDLAGYANRAKMVGVAYSKSTDTPLKIKERYLDPIPNPYGREKNGKEKWEREKSDAKKGGDRLFAQFLDNGLTAGEKAKVEFIWNSTYNSHKEYDRNQIPIGFTFKKYDGKFLNDIRPEKRDAIAYYLGRGSVGLAYGVGIGKTFCAVFILRQALYLGICKRPLLLVPNQVYFQFMDEVGRILGNTTQINPIYNGAGFLQNKLANNIKDNHITIATYEALQLMVFDKKNTEKSFLSDKGNILEMGGNNPSADLLDNTLEMNKETLFAAGDFEDDTDVSMDEGGKVSKIKIDKTLPPPIYINSDTTNFDFVCVDEVHNFNNLFSKVVAAPKEFQKGTKTTKGKIRIAREHNPYNTIRETSSGKAASKRAEKLYFLNAYIQEKNPMGNTLFLSATPFTNSPLQVFTMFVYLNWKMLVDSDLEMIKNFFDLFANVEYADDFKTDLSVVRRTKFTGWQNVIALQKFLYRVFDKPTKENEEKFVKRPNKIVLPLRRIKIDQKTIDLSEENRISTTIKMTPLQIELWKDVQDYAAGKKTYKELCTKEKQNTTSLGKYVPPKETKPADANPEDATETSVEDADELKDGTKEGEKANKGVRALQCLMWGRQICLNPYLYKCSGFKKEPSGKEYIEASPKMLYVMRCIKEIKDFHKKSKTKMSGQVIYMNFGVKAFPLMKEYLVEELGFAEKEIGIITGKDVKIGKKTQKNKNVVADAFMGRKKVEGDTANYEELPDEDRVKVLLGSEAIKEGINLQNYASVLYNIFLDFNPTDQVQVEGRIWRQGNSFANVRIVIPLMSDCIDVFMFQKLEDKTQRINQLWTRDNATNELDTTAFNPAELKFELSTNPTNLAKLEKEYRIELLEEEIMDVNDTLSELLSVKSIFDDVGNITTLLMPHSLYRLTRAYVLLSILSPDLLDKPLFKEKMNGKIWHRLMRTKNRSNQMGELEKINISQYVNYTPEDLILLIKQFFLDKKIAYPYSYSKDWREEITTKVDFPLMVGDIVEFDTRSGRRKGTITYVANKSGESLVEALKTEYDKDKSDKFYIKALKDNYAHLIRTNQWKPQEEDSQSKLLPYYVDVDNIEDISIDGKNVERVEWGDKELEKEFEVKEVEVDKKEIPEPFSLQTKESPEKVWDLTQFYEWGENIPTDVYNKIDNAGMNTNTDEPQDLNGLLISILKNPPKELTKEQVMLIYWWQELGLLGMIYGSNLKREISVDGQTTPNIEPYKQIVNSFKKEFGYKNLNDPFKIEAEIKKERWENDEGEKRFHKYKESIMYQSGLWSLLKNIKNEEVDKWINIQDELINVAFGAFYKSNKDTGGEVFTFEYPKLLTQRDEAVEKQLKPKGLNNIQDLEREIKTTREEIADKELQIKNFEDEENFKELVQEMERKLSKMSEEDIRGGNTYKARAKEFATPNPDYKGNDYLLLMQEDTDVKQVKTTTTPKEVETPVKQIDFKDLTKVEIERKIGSLERAMVFLKDKNMKEQNKLRIKRLKLIVKYAN